MTWTTKGVFLAFVFILGGVCGWKLGSPGKEQTNGRTPLPEVRFAPGAAVLEQNAPGTKPPPVHHLPKGSRITAEQTVTVQPPPSKLDPHPAPVEITLATIEAPSGIRVLAETPSGDLTGRSWDLGPPPKVYRWNAQAVRLWTMKGATWGGSLGWERGPMVASITVFPGQVQAGIGIRW